MNFLTRYVRQWIDRLSEPRLEFGGNPACPYSKRAMFSVATVCDENDLAGLLRCVTLEPWRVLLILVDFPNAEEIRKVLKVQKLSLAQRDLIALPSNPKHPMIVQGFRTTQENYFFVIVQRKSEIEKASVALRARGYYSNWTKEQLAWLEDRE